MTQPRSITSAEHRWEQLAREQEFKQLAEVRATAEKWRNGLTGVTGLLAVVLSVAAPAAGEHLEARWRALVGVLQMAALLALAFGGWNAMKAAFGEPASIRNNGVRLQAWQSAATSAAVRQLAWARSATCLGFVLLACAVGAGVMAPRAGAGIARVTDHNDKTYCGKLESLEQGVGIRLTSDDGTVRNFRVSDLRGLTLLKDGC